MYKKESNFRDRDTPEEKGGAPEASSRLTHRRKCRENLISETEIPLKDGMST